MGCKKYRIDNMYGVLRTTRQGKGFLGPKTRYMLEIPSLKEESSAYGDNGSSAAKPIIAYLASRGLVKKDGTQIITENPSGIEVVLGALDDMGWELKRDSHNSLLKLKLKTNLYSGADKDVSSNFVETTEYALGIFTTSRYKLESDKKRTLRYELDIPSLNIHLLVEDPSKIETVMNSLQNDKGWEMVNDDGDLIMLKRKRPRFGQERIR